MQEEIKEPDAPESDKPVVAEQSEGQPSDAGIGEHPTSEASDTQHAPVAPDEPVAPVAPEVDKQSEVAEAESQPSAPEKDGHAQVTDSVVPESEISAAPVTAVVADTLDHPPAESVPMTNEAAQAHGERLDSLVDRLDSILVREGPRVLDLLEMFVMDFE